MKYAFYITLAILFSCSGDNEKNSPQVIDEIFYSDALAEYCCKTIFKRPSDPVLLDNGDILFDARNHVSLESTYFKFLGPNYNTLKPWNESINWNLRKVQRVIDGEMLFFPRYDEEIVQVNLKTMETLKNFPAAYQKDLIIKLDDNIYFTRFISDAEIGLFQINLNTEEKHMVHSFINSPNGEFFNYITPKFYINNDGDHCVFYYTQIDGEMLLHNHNISKNDLIWRKELNEFELSEANPTYLNVYGKYIIVDSNDFISVRDRDTGNALWDYKKFVTQNEDNPYPVKDAVIVPQSHSILCLNLKNGNLKWSLRMGENGLRWGSSIEFKSKGGYLFLDHNPIELATGKMYWTSLDRWEEQDYGYFRTNPVVDLEKEVLYYLIEDRIISVKLPK